MALEKVEGVTSAFVDRGILLLLDNEEPLDEDAIRAALSPFDITVDAVQKTDQLPF